MDQRLLRDAFGQFATGVTVVTCTNADGEPHGATVNAFTAVSLDPPLAQVTLGRSSRACEFLADREFGINILAADQVDVAWHFAGRPAAVSPAWLDDGPVPVLAGTAATIRCRPWRTYDGGDHLIVIGEVEQVRIAGVDPLLFHAGAFRHLGTVESTCHWHGSIDNPDHGWFDSTAAFTPLAASAAS
ncbi:flavin reductase family protein [Nocardioides daejeonensis]|uniref:flavin reductase family protein n=1 Tax=Nocardioides daejeonensis TaxID=1046556 RepID=UPI000D744A1E|nr:flavin reductase family protein [Nocardioides daejeonensis]